MLNLKEYIDSGILELYVLGVTDTKENKQIEKLCSTHFEIREEIKNITAALENYAMQNAVAPDPTIKPFLMATIDYHERMKNGEEPSFPPVLNERSTISDYEQWINRKDIKLPENFKDFHAKIIGLTPKVTTAIIWIKDMAPEEMHTNEIEKFLILEGTCDVNVENETYSYQPGDYFSIPLYKKHDVRITSSIPCKAILQRIAA